MFNADISIRSISRQQHKSLKFQREIMPPSSCVLGRKMENKDIVKNINNHEQLYSAVNLFEEMQKIFL